MLRKRCVHLSLYLCLLICLPLVTWQNSMAGKCQYHSLNHNNLQYREVRLKNGGKGIEYRFSFDLYMHCPGSSTADKIVSLGMVNHKEHDYYEGTYSVTALFDGKRFDERITEQVKGENRSSLILHSEYTCTDDPLQRNGASCHLDRRSKPEPGHYPTVVQELAHYSVPLSRGLLATSGAGFFTGSEKPEPPAKRAGNKRYKLVDELVYTRHKFSRTGRKYFFTFTGYDGCIDNPTIATNAPCKALSLEAMATKVPEEKKVEIAIRGSGRSIDLVYQCDDMLDPFLDPGNSCTQQTFEFSDSWAKSLAERKISLLDLFRKAISSSQRMVLVWDALAASMTPRVFEGGKAAPEDGSEPVFGTDSELVLDVESSRDIRRSGDQEVKFFVTGKNGPVRDTSGNIIEFPLVSKYVGNVYNGTLKIIGPLEPGEYQFWTSMRSTLTQTRESEKIRFRVGGTVMPDEAPVILAPRENEKIKDGSSIGISVQVAPPESGNDFWAKIQIEYSRLATQDEYKKVDEIILRNPGKRTKLDLYWQSNVKNGAAGDYRVRAQMYRKNKSGGSWTAGPWSDWRHFHVGGVVLPHMHRGLDIFLPKEKQVYTGTIPVKISLPESMKTEDKLVLNWALVGDDWARLLLRKTVAVKPAPYYETTQDVAKLMTAADAGTGDLELSIHLVGADKSDSVRFKVGMLGTPVENPGQKMSGHITFDRKKTQGALASGLRTRNKLELSTGARSINPQPEPPGRGMKSLSMPLQVILPRKSFRVPATVTIGVRNTPFRRLPFELRYRSGASGPYRKLSGIRYEFSRHRDQTTLTLHLDRAGRYQVRFRGGHRSSWTPWQEFTLGTGKGPVAEASRIAASKSGEVLRGVSETSGKRGFLKEKKLAGMGLVPAVAVKIVSPKNGQKFMLAAKRMTVSALVSHAMGERVKVEVERKVRGGYDRMSTGIRLHPGKKQTRVEITVSQPGEYRIRAKGNAHGSKWSGRVVFIVDRLTRNPPRLEMPRMPLSESNGSGAPLPVPSLPGNQLR